MPRLTTLLLCDFAQVREGLLFVSSGGVSRVVQGNYPANPRLHLAMVVHLPAASLGQSHQVHVRLKYPDTAEVIANAEVAIQLNAVSGAYLASRPGRRPGVDRRTTRRGPVVLVAPRRGQGPMSGVCRQVGVRPSTRF
jgi:hypothetical protein